MLGHQAELAEQIQTAKNNLEKTKSEYEVQNKIVEENGKIECQQSPKYYIKKCVWHFREIHPGLVETN